MAILNCGVDVVMFQLTFKMFLSFRQYFRDDVSSLKIAQYEHNLMNRYQGSISPTFYERKSCS